MTAHRLNREYFEWLVEQTANNDYSEHTSFRKLLTHLHDIEFTFLMDNDQDRAEDGVSLRYRFAISNGYDDLVDEILDILDGPCSVLEMMVALAIHCEDWMDDALMGDRTSQWFWQMIVNLGLGSMTDARFNEQIVDEAIDRLLNREYEPDGRGGLFYIRRCDEDVRDVAIWRQMCWYLNTIV